jgi:hypothetical protein
MQLSVEGHRSMPEIDFEEEDPYELVQKIQNWVVRVILPELQLLIAYCTGNIPSDLSDKAGAYHHYLQPIAHDLHRANAVFQLIGAELNQFFVNDPKLPRARKELYIQMAQPRPRKVFQLYGEVSSFGLIQALTIMLQNVPRLPVEDSSNDFERYIDSDDLEPEPGFYHSGQF